MPIAYDYLTGVSEVEGKFETVKWVSDIQMQVILGDF